MTLTNPIGPPPNHYDPAWVSRFWGWLTKVWFPFGRDSDGNVDHGQLGGLTDDDHTQYVRTGSTGARGNIIGDLSVPVGPADAATKAYVDDLITQLDATGLITAANAATTKGDILAFNGSSWEIVPVGTDGQFLTADSGASAGVSWT